MKFKSQNAPHISHDETTRTLMLNVLLVLMVLYAMAFFYYGPRALLLGVVGGGTALLTDALSSLFFGRKPHLQDFSPLVTGLMVPLMMPASIPFHVPVIATVFGLAIAKHPFGGVGHNIFNPAAAGYAFAVTSFPASVMFMYPIPKAPLPIFPGDSLQLVTSSTFSLSIGGVPSYGVVNTALGNSPGPMGATHGLVLVACLLFLISRRTVRWQLPVFFLATTSVIALLFPRAAVRPHFSLFHETLSGLLLFGAVLMMGDPVTTPTRPWAKTAYAIMAGVIVMLYRHVGRLEEGFPFALLLMNALVWGFDMLAEMHAAKRREKRLENIKNT